MEEQRLPVFAKRFQFLRRSRQLSQDEFAKFLGISRPTVGFYENGTRLPDALILQQIAEKCCVSSDWLIGLSNIDKIPPKSEFPIVDQMTAKFYKKFSNLAEEANNRELFGLFQNLLDIFPDHIGHCTDNAIARCMWVLKHIELFYDKNSDIVASYVIYFLDHGFFIEQDNQP